MDAENFWDSTPGKRYFQNNVDLVRRNVSVTRVFIGDRAALQRFRPIILRHRDAGIRVLVVPTDEIPRDLCEDYLISDDALVARIYLTLEGIAREERITVDKQEVRRAMINFDRLVAAAHEYEDLFPDAPRA